MALDRDGKVTGTKELLFVIARDEGLYFIDILDHDAFGEQHLFDTALINWPDIVKRAHMPALAPGHEVRGEPRLAALTASTSEARG